MSFGMPELQRWRNALLSESIASLDAGVSVNAEDRPHAAGEIGILKTSALSGGVFKPEQNKAVLAVERHRVAEPVVGDSILLSRMNTPALVGESCYVDIDWPTLFVPDRIWQLKPRSRDSLSMRWLSYVLRSAAARAHIETNANGTSGSMKNLPKSKLLDMRVQLPPVREQQVIAEVLDTLDTTIRQTEAIIEKLMQVKQGLLHDLLTRGIDDNGELRPPQSQAPHLYKESPLGWIPRDWRCGAAAEWCDRLSVGIVTGSTHAYVPMGVPFIRSQDVKPNRIEIDKVLHISKSFSAANSKSRLSPGDVVIVRTGYPGTAAVVPPELEGANCFSLVVATPASTRLDSYFLAQYMNSAIGKAQIGRLQFGSAQHNFNVGEMRLLPTPLPPLLEQSSIVKIMDMSAARIDAVGVELAKLRTLKSGLMDDLLTGRVRVNPLLEASP